jgi:hypothetical protein
MGFVSSSSTVVVEAKLTSAGRRLMSGVDVPPHWGSPNITKFGIGDSDINYSAITSAGSNLLNTGYVPQPGKHAPVIKYKTLQYGIVAGNVGDDPLDPDDPPPIDPPPSDPPTIIIDGHGGDWATIEWNAGLVRSLSYNISTNWPPGVQFDELYSYDWHAETDEEQNFLMRYMFVSHTVSDKYTTITLALHPEVIYPFNPSNGKSFILSIEGLQSGGNKELPFWIHGLSFPG